MGVTTAGLMVGVYTEAGSRIGGSHIGRRYAFFDIDKYIVAIGFDATDIRAILNHKPLYGKRSFRPRFIESGDKHPNLEFVNKDLQLL
tara:strand:+ start:14379 stop:14642 length:264 start_codon:yes stop_codon:yes gene_type:complete